MRHDLGRGQPGFGRMDPDRIGKLPLCGDGTLTHAAQPQCHVQLGALHGQEPHGRTAHRLAWRPGIRRIILAALDDGVT